MSSDDESARLDLEYEKLTAAGWKIPNNYLQRHALTIALVATNNLPGFVRYGPEGRENISKTLLELAYASDISKQLIEVREILKHAKEQVDFVHGNLTAKNVFVDADGGVKLDDFRFSSARLGFDDYSIVARNPARLSPGESDWQTLKNSLPCLGDPLEC